jgi:F0F1-type ATP synthase assembly protein I
MAATVDARFDRRSWRRIAGLFLRWGLALAVLGFVASNAAKLWDAEQVERLTIDPLWLVASGLSYTLGWLPSVWFMRRLLSESGHRVSPLSVARSYYCGHLGKYVPGKATVVLIRAVMLRDRGVPFGAGALATVAETLAMMGTGLALTLALATYALPDAAWQRLPASLLWLRDSPGFVTLAVVLLTLVTVPAVTGFAGRVAGKLAQRSLAVRHASTAADMTADEQVDDSGSGNAADNWTLKLSAGLLIQALLVFCGAWFLMGLSLLCVLNAIDDPGFSFSRWLICTAAAPGGTSIGFFVLIAPGGLGIREGLIFATISPLVGAPLAGAASILLRAVWFVTEVAMSGTLYLIPGRKPTA